MDKKKRNTLVVAILVFIVSLVYQYNASTKYQLSCQRGGDSIEFTVRIKGDERSLVSVKGADESNTKVPDAVEGESSEEYLQRFVDANADYFLGMRCSVSD